MKKKGSALIYAILISVPVMIIAVALLSYTSGDMRISTYTIKSKQAFYNAESGIEYARSGCSKKAANITYYLDYNNTNINGSNIYSTDAPKNDNNDAKLTVESYNDGLQITSIGNYMGISKTVIRYVKLNSNAGGFNLNRKFNVGDFICNNNNTIKFHTRPGNGNIVQEEERFLLLDPSNYNNLNNNNITIIKKNDNNSCGIKDSDDFLLTTQSKCNLPEIDSICDKNEWINYDDSVQYYIATGDNKNFDLYSICTTNGNPIFDSSRLAKVILVDGNLTINNNSVQYLNNTVIYCKGTIYLGNANDNCNIVYNKDDDYNVCFISDSISINGNVTFSYNDGNSFKIGNKKNPIDCTNSIINILSNNIKSDISWK